MCQRAHNIFNLLASRQTWVSNFELMNHPTLYGRRYGARIQDLRDRGLDIVGKHGAKHPEYLYKLMTPIGMVDRTGLTPKLKPAKPQGDMFVGG